MEDRDARSDQSHTPVLDAPVSYWQRGDLSFTPPGHKQGRGIDPRVLDVLGSGIFRADVMALNGLDDRRMTGGVLERAQQLMAEAVRADRTFFSTCGSSLSVKSAMLAVAGPGENTVADDTHTAQVLIDALRALPAADLPHPAPVRLPEPGELELESVTQPREAFFGPAEQVPADQAVGRVAAEMITPYPPGAPAIIPGERITRPVVDYLRTGAEAGMYIPDAADPSIKSIRVVAR
jgi:arginine/lysine/ornithine decarboxylase